MIEDRREINRVFDINMYLRDFRNNIFPVLIGFALLCNILLITALSVKRRSTKLSSSSLFALICLLICNAVCLATEFFRRAEERRRTIMYDKFKYFRFGMALIGFLSFQVPINIQCIISAERVIAGFYPHRVRTIFTLKRVVFTLTCCFSATFIIQLLVTLLNTLKGFSGIVTILIFLGSQSLLLLVFSYILTFQAIREKLAISPSIDTRSVREIGPLLLVFINVAHIASNSVYVNILIRKIYPAKWTDSYYISLVRDMRSHFLAVFQLFPAVTDWLIMVCMAGAIRRAVWSMFRPRICCKSSCSDSDEVRQKRLCSDV